MSADLSRCVLPPFHHQVVGVERIITGTPLLLADEMGSGKSKQVIDAAQVMFTTGRITRVIIIAPLPVLDVWYDPELGELARHLWAGVPVLVTKYRSKPQQWRRDGHGPELRWVISNYDYIRANAGDDSHLRTLIKVCDRKTLLVIDESSAIKYWKSEQTKACKILRKKCGFVVELNGTPVAHTPADLYSQADILSQDVLGCSTWFHFRARYCVMGGFKNKKIVKFINLEDLQQRMAPYVLRRLKSDCLDLPEKLPPVTITAALTPKTWKMYKEMREEMVLWLTSQSVSVAPQAVTKAIRLAQLCSGFLGGVADLDEDGMPTGADPHVVEVSQEKLDVVLEWLRERLAADPALKVLLWCRFRAEVARLASALPALGFASGTILGGQAPEDRAAALRLLDPRTAPRGPAGVVGTPASGSMGLNLTAADHCLYLSNDYSLKTRLQSMDRVHRPGQVRPVWYGDVVATGPDGQKTVDHHVIKALREHEDLATWTCSAWIRALSEE